MDGSNGARRDPSSHKGMRQKLERVESSLNAVPPAMEEAVEGLEAHCTAGIKLASLMETVLQDSPLLLLALRYKEACETLLDKTSRSGLAMKGELVAPVKRLGPSVSRLRSRIDSHAKASSRHEACAKQLEGITLSSSTSRSKQEQVEAKFRSSAQDFAQEDRQLILANTEFTQMRTELMGGCFLSYLEVVSRLIETASDLFAPLGTYKDLRHELYDSPSSATMKEATVSWLAATQVNQNLRSFGGLSRNDVQCMLYQHPDGLPDTIRSGLNNKVDQLLKLYSSGLARVEAPHHVLTGGFHFNPKAIELALKDCCSELEAKGAGADHAHSAEAKSEQISCDVPRTTYTIGGQHFGAATGEQAADNILEKKAAVRRLLTTLPAVSSDQTIPGDHTLDDYAEHVLNESCTTVTNTTAKTAVQLVFGKANLVLVRPCPSGEETRPINITARTHDSTITITVHSSWWLVEDYAAFAMLQRPFDPSACLGVVDACYTITLSLENYCSDIPRLELPTVAVTYCQPPAPSPASAGTSPPSHPIVGTNKDKEKLLGSFTTQIRNKFRNMSHKTRGKPEGNHTHLESAPRRVSSPRAVPTLQLYTKEEDGGRRDKEERESSRKTSSESEEVSESTGARYSGGQYPSGRSDSFGRGVRPPFSRHGMKRSESNDTLSSQSTLVPRTSLLDDDHPMGIADLIRAPSHPTLTQSRIWAHDKSALSRHRGYQNRRKGGKEREREEEEEEEADGEGGGKDDDRRTIEGSPSSQEISIASDMEMERVFTLLSNNPHNFERSFSDEYEGRRDSSYQSDERKGGYDGRRGDEYQPRGGDNYGYKYSYDSSGYPGMSGYGGEGERRERGYVDEDQKERGDNSSSGSSGIEDQYGTHRSRSGSATSLLTDHEGRGRGRGEGEGSHRVPSGSNASIDSGIGGPAHLRVPGGGERGRGEGVDSSRPPHGPKDLPFNFISKGLGSLIPTHHSYDFQDQMFDRRDSVPVSSSSSGGSSPVMFRTRSASEENLRLPERSASRSSTHSMPPGALHSHGSSTSLNDFDHTPGSRPRPFDCADRLSQGSYWDYPQQKPPPREHFGHHPYNYLPPGGPPMGPPGGPPMGPIGGPPHGGPYNYEGDYLETHHERPSRSMLRGGRAHSEDFSPSPGPPLDHRHQPPPYWHGPAVFNGPPPQGNPGCPPGQMPPPHSSGPPGGRMLPPRPHPMHEFRPVQFRPVTPSNPSPASLHSMSPGPSPHPTPPPTPPPPHGPLRPPPMPPPYRSPGPPVHMHPRDFRPPPPPQPGPHGFQGQMPPRDPNFAPLPRFGLSPSPGPPVSAPGRYPPGPPWDGWGPH